MLFQYIERFNNEVPASRGHSKKLLDCTQSSKFKQEQTGMYGMDTIGNFGAMIYVGY